MSAANVAQLPHAKVNFSALAFYREYAGVYQDIWAVLGRTWTNLAAESVWSRETIPGKQHGELKIQLTTTQREALMPLLTRMQFFRGLRLNGGTYTELEITGAKFSSMCERTRIIIDRLKETDQKHKVSFERIIFQVGNRPRMNHTEQTHFDGTVEEIYSRLTDKVKAHPWVVEQMSLMNEPNATEMWKGAFATEYYLGILAFIIATDGDIQVESFEPCTAGPDMPDMLEVPLRTSMWCTLRLPDNTPVFVLNGPAVFRPQAPDQPRPTTTSNTKYRLEHFPPYRGGKIVTVSGKTHWYRVIGSFERELHSRFPDITVFGMSNGAETTDEARGVLNNALGEVVWILQKAYEEVLTCLTG